MMLSIKAICKSENNEEVMIIGFELEGYCLCMKKSGTIFHAKHEDFTIVDKEYIKSFAKESINVEFADFLEKASARLDQIQSKQLTSIILELQEYQNKIEQGKMIELPCKVGDTVYIDERTWTWYNSCFNRAYIGGEFFVVGKITSIRFTDKSILIKAKATYRENQRLYKKRDYPISAIGKTVFLTREEAEKRLKEITESK